MKGVVVTDLAEFSNEHGSVQKMLSSNDASMTFGEIYFSTINPGVRKGWHRHTVQTSRLSCVKGKVRLALVRGDEHEDVVFGDGARKLVVIGPGVAYAWENLSADTSIIANCASHPHDPNETEKIPIEDISHDW